MKEKVENKQVSNIRVDQFDTLNESLIRLGRISAEIVLRMDELVETQKKIEQLHAKQVDFWNRNERTLNK